jgi:hypothetical protein
MENILSSKLIAVLNSLTEQNAIEALHPDSDYDSRREHEARLLLRDQVLKALGIFQEHPTVKEWNQASEQECDRSDLEEDSDRHLDARDDAFEPNFEF